MMPQKVNFTVLVVIHKFCNTLHGVGARAWAWVRASACGVCGCVRLRGGRAGACVCVRLYVFSFVRAYANARGCVCVYLCVRTCVCVCD